MSDIDNSIITAIDESMFNLIDQFDNRLPLDLLGRVVKDVLLDKKYYIVIENKRISPNRYIKKTYKSFSKFINLKTNFKIITENNEIFISL